MAAGFGRAVAIGVLAAGMVTSAVACVAGGGDSGATSSTTPITSTQTLAPSRPSTAAAAACPAPAVGQVDAASVLVAGPVNGMPASDAGGDKLAMMAVVLDSACKPVHGANVRIWHADARGLYGRPGTQECCYYGGTVRTDGNGLFRVETIRPGQYPQPDAPPAHIHVEIEHSSGRLETEIVFTTSPRANQSCAVAMELRPSNGQQDRRSWHGEVALVLDR
jgi:protocatechuate 3,4-dioxygenase beta subunit